ncbi:hypothetical protein L1987_46060 [Smallanthus sonchifolius]|uniref:Uncharacterized protein n=1 Tax=Smallanthus sonchifolius TaxID=185202 RepID=A0ACB9FYS1_9ASTR|nr:hypothetical protein L1987_46060 [Smallanthus sonchifolius]
MYDRDEDGETKHDVDDEDEGDDNQVVPLSHTPPPAASSSRNDDDSIGDRSVLVKLKCENVADLSEDDVDCLSVQKSHREVSPADRTHPSKEADRTPPLSTTAAARLEKRHHMPSSATIEHRRSLPSLVATRIQATHSCLHMRSIKIDLLC